MPGTCGQLQPAAYTEPCRAVTNRIQVVVDSVDREHESSTPRTLLIHCGSWQPLPSAWGALAKAQGAKPAGSYDEISDANGTAGPSRGTRIKIVRNRWTINGRVTYPGARAEGLLMNVRMVNSIFEDRKRPDFDADANTAAFVARIPDYAAGGVRAFTVGLQGGMPGYEGAANSAFNPDGSLRPSYLDRARASD